jgi:hypothetical protein
MYNTLNILEEWKPGHNCNDEVKEDDIHRPGSMYEGKAESMQGTGGKT